MTLLKICTNFVNFFINNDFERKPNSRYQEENSKFTLMRNCVMNNCIGPMEAFVAGAVSNCTFESCIAVNCKVRKP